MELINTNLLTTYDKGRFESAPADWPAGYAHITKAQIDLANAGISMEGDFAGSFELTSDDPDVADMNRFIAFTFAVTEKKKYSMKLKVYIPAGDPPADDTARLILIPYPYPNANITQEFTNNWNVLLTAAKGTVKEMEYRFEAQANQTITFVLAVTTDPVTWNASGNYITGGVVYIDNAIFQEYASSPGDLSPAAPVAIYFHRNPAVIQVNANPANLAQHNYRLYCEVYVENTYLAGNYKPELAQELPPDASNQALFYLNEAFADLLQTYLPAVQQTFSDQATKGLKRFRIYTGEKYGADPQVQALSLQENFLMLAGGVAKELNTALDFLDSFGPVNRKFLTWAPSEALVSESQENYLYFLLYSSISGFRVMAQIYYTDGTNQTFQLYAWDGSPNLNKGNIYVLPVGFTQAKIGLKNTAKTVTKYQVYVTDPGGSVISEQRTYTIDRSGNSFQRYFLFENSLGGFDSLRTMGKSEVQARAEFDEVEKILPSVAQDEPQFEKIIPIIDDEIKVSTGHVKKEYAEYLRELLISRRVFETVNGRRVPVLINTKSFSIVRDTEYLYYLRFDYRYAYRNEVYTPRDYSNTKIVQQR